MREREREREFITSALVLVASSINFDSSFFLQDDITFLRESPELIMDTSNTRTTQTALCTVTENAERILILRASKSRVHNPRNALSVVRFSACSRADSSRCNEIIQEEIEHAIPVSRGLSDTVSGATFSTCRSKVATSTRRRDGH